MDIGEAPSDPTKEGEGGEEVTTFIARKLTAIVPNNDISSPKHDP